MSKDLPRSAAAAQQVDPAAVLAFVDAVEADPAIELHSLMVVRHGHVVAEGWWAPHTPERTRLLYSLSKSFTSTALGFALEEGRVGWTIRWCPTSPSSTPRSPILAAARSRCATWPRWPVATTAT